MPQGFRPSRVADQIRAELGELLAREVHDPGVGFVTLTRVQLTVDLQIARVYYTTLGDGAARRGTARAVLHHSASCGDAPTSARNRNRSACAARA